MCVFDLQVKTLCSHALANLSFEGSCRRAMVREELVMGMRSITATVDGTTHTDTASHTHKAQAEPAVDTREILWPSFWSPVSRVLTRREVPLSYMEVCPVRPRFTYMEVCPHCPQAVHWRTRRCCSTTWRKTRRATRV